MLIYFKFVFWVSFVVNVDFFVFGVFVNIVFNVVILFNNNKFIWRYLNEIFCGLNFIVIWE